MNKILFFLVFLFIGCGSSEYFYWDVNVSKSVKKKVPISISFPDYMKSGYVVGMDGDKFIYLNYQIPETVEKFYGEYLIKSLQKYGIGARIYPWGFNRKINHVVNIKIIDYYIDLKNKRAVLRVGCCNKRYVFEKKYKDNYLKAYKEVFDEMIKKIGGKL